MDHKKPAKDQVLSVPKGYPGFLLRIVRPDGSILEMPAGHFAADFVQGLLDHLEGKPVGVFHTKSQVIATVREAITEYLSEVQYDMHRNAWQVHSR